VGALSPLAATGIISMDLLTFFFISFLPALIGMGLAAAVSWFRKGHVKNISEGN
jgi:hypothetical protein